jgi:hypothetical protein
MAMTRKLTDDEIIQPTDLSELSSFKFDIQPVLYNIKPSMFSIRPSIKNYLMLGGVLPSKNMNPQNGIKGNANSHDSNLWLHIFLFLNVRDILTLRMTCHFISAIELRAQMYDAIKSEKFKKTCLSKFKLTEYLSNPVHFQPALVHERGPNLLPNFPEAFLNILGTRNTLFSHARANEFKLEVTKDLVMPGNDGFILKR